MLNFTALDFETANSHRGSPCSVGLVKVRDGQVAKAAHWLIRPPEPVDHFSSFNTSIHGITAEDVRDSPRWRLVLPAIADFIGGDPVVAHNAGFDIGVIRAACAIDSLEWPTIDFLCTLALARRVFSLPSYRLPFVTQAAGVPLVDHHDALADATAVATLVCTLAQAEGVGTLDELASRFTMRIGRMSEGSYRSSAGIYSSTGSRPQAASVNPDADPDGYLYGRVVVFTGALASMTRQIAWDAVTHAGVIPEANATKRTNVLVLGDVNPASLRPGVTLSGKAQKAFALQDKGQDIELMTEADFLQVLEGIDVLGDLDRLAP